MSDAGSVVGLLHLAQAAEAEGNGPYSNDVPWWTAEELEPVMGVGADADFVSALAPSVVVALLERLQRAEAVCVAVEAQAQFSDRTHGQAWVDVMAEDRLLQDAVDESLAAWRGVTGLQEPE